MKFKTLTAIAIVCLLIVIWINFVDLKVPELIPGKGSKFEGLIEGFCRSFIAAYIFYSVNVYLKERREKKFILPLVANNVILLVVNNHTIVKCLKNDLQLSHKFYPTDEEFKELLSKVDPRETATMFSKEKNWLHLFENRRKSTLSYITKIFSSGRHIDDELRKILLEIQSSLYLSDGWAFNALTFDEKNLEKYHYVFFKYFSLIQDLSNYFDKNLKSYYESTLPKTFKEFKVVDMKVI